MNSHSNPKLWKMIWSCFGRVEYPDKRKNRKSLQYMVFWIHEFGPLVPRLRCRFFADLSRVTEDSGEFNNASSWVRQFVEAHQVLSIRFCGSSELHWKFDGFLASLNHPVGSSSPPWQCTKYSQYRSHVHHWCKVNSVANANDSRYKLLCIYHQPTVYLYYLPIFIDIIRNTINLLFVFAYTGYKL